MIYELRGLKMLRITALLVLVATLCGCAGGTIQFTDTVGYPYYSYYYSDSFYSPFYYNYNPYYDWAWEEYWYYY